MTYGLVIIVQQSNNAIFNYDVAVSNGRHNNFDFGFKYARKAIKLFHKPPNKGGKVYV